MGEIVDGEYQKYSVESGAYYPRALLRHRPATAGDGQASLRRAAPQDAPRRARPRKGLRRLQGRRGAQGLAHRHPGAHDQGLRARRGRRRPQHHAPAEEAQRRRVARVPQPLRHSDFGRGYRGRRRSTARPTTAPEMQYLHERREALGGYVPHRDPTVQAHGSGARGDLPGVLQGHRGPRSIHDDGLRAHALQAAARQGTRQATSCPSSPTRRARSAWRRSSARSASTPTSASSTSRSTRKHCSITRKPRTGRFSRKASPRPASMSSFIAAGTACPTHGINMIPFFIYYSMFGFQRIGDLIWAAADSRCRGFLLGGTAGRTTLAGEGLQHQDGHSHVHRLRRAQLHLPTTRRSPTKSPSSFRTASGGCTTTARASSTTSPS